MKAKLEEVVNDFYSEKNLSKRQLNLLGKMERQYPLNDSKKPVFSLPKFAFGVPLVVACLLLFWFIMPGDMSKKQEIIRQIAYNHLKMLDTEIQTGDLKEVRSYLAKLDFNVVFAERLKTEEWVLIGARYCSIDKKLAAQIRIRHIPSGELYTWYQVKGDSSFKQLLKGKSVTDYSDGVKVVLWEENNILHGLAGENILTGED